MSERFKSIEQRKELLDRLRRLFSNTRSFLKKTSKPFDSENKRLDLIEKSLSESQLKIVVIGEFSRGKSTLLNALLGQKTLLPTALEQTTAVNTFLKGLPPNESEPFIQILREDDTKERLPYGEDVIRSWGSELDRTKKDLRQAVSKIEVFSDHKLLKNDLILIDTPGFQGILEKHERIAMEAITEAHVAIWLMSATQFGGTETEWKFLRNTVQKQFNKFLLVVTHWDKVLKPDDEHEKKKTEDERVTGKKEILRERFREGAGNIPQEKVDQLTGDKHLYLIPSIWAFSEDKRERSKAEGELDRLAKRIEELCVTPEGLEQTLAKPLTDWTNLVGEADRTLAEDLKALESTKTSEENEREIAVLLLEKERAENEIRRVESDSKLEHNENCNELLDEIQKRLIEPLKGLKDEVAKITKAEIRAQLEKKQEKVGLPSWLEEEIEQENDSFQKRWSEIKKGAEDQLLDLGVSFSKELEQAKKGEGSALSSVSISLPPLSISETINLGAIEKQYEELRALENEAASEERKIEELGWQLEQTELQHKQILDTKREREGRLARIEAKRERLGLRPAPETYIEYKEEQQSWWIFWTQTVQVPVKRVDYTAQTNYDQELKKLREAEQNEEGEIKRIQQEAFEQQKMVLSYDRAKKAAQKELERQKKKLDLAKAKASADFEEVVERTHTRLVKGTEKRLEQMLRTCEKTLKEGIKGAFEANLAMLVRCAKERWSGKIQEHSTRLQELETKKKEGHAAVERQKTKTKELLGEIKDLRDIRDDILKDVQKHFATTGGKK